MFCFYYFSITVSITLFLFFRCRGLVLLETYSAAYDQDSLLASLPKFLTIEKEVTGDPAYSMYNLSLKEDWKTSKRYYRGNDCNGELCRVICHFVSTKHLLVGSYKGNLIYICCDVLSVYLFFV